MTLVDSNAPVVLPSTGAMVPSKAKSNVGFGGRDITDLRDTLKRQERDTSGSLRDLNSNPNPNPGDMIEVQRKMQAMLRTAELITTVLAAFHNAIMSILKNIK